MMEEKIRQKVKAERVARWTTRGFWIGLIGLLVLLVIELGDRLSLMLGEQFFWVMVPVVGVLEFGTLILHLFIFPKKIQYYPEYRDSGVDVARFMSKPRLKVGGVIVIAVALISSVMDRCWPIGTMPRELPQTFYYAIDKHEIRGGDFGTMAFPMFGGEFWVCQQVKAYGPFDYAGELDELTLERISITEVFDTETEERLADRGELRRWLVRFNHYEDGDWMIVKLFVRSYEPQPGGYYLKLNGESAMAMLNTMVESGKIGYDVYEFDRDTDQIAILETATDGILGWRKTEEGLIWIANPMEAAQSDDEL